MKKLIFTLILCFASLSFASPVSSFGGFLEADTQVIVTIGPFVDVADHVTPETAVTLTGGGDNADEAELLKNGSTSVVDISSNTWAAVTNCDGWYSLTLTTSDTDTEGNLLIVIQNDSVHDAVSVRYEVQGQAAYNSEHITKASGYIDVDVTAISTSTTAADNEETAFDTDFATNYDAANDMWVTNVGLWNSNSIPCTTAQVVSDAAASGDVADSVLDELVTDHDSTKWSLGWMLKKIYDYVSW